MISSLCGCFLVTFLSVNDSASLSADLVICRSRAPQPTKKKRNNCMSMKTHVSIGGNWLRVRKERLTSAALSFHGSLTRIG